MALRAFGSFLGVLLLLVACGRPVHPSHPDSVERICNARCHRTSECDPKANVAACQDDCRAHGSPARPHWRADFVAAGVQCTETAECSVILDKKALTETCYRGKRPEPTARLRQYCEKVIEKDRICNHRQPDLAKCVDDWRIVDDMMLDDLTDCVDRPCGKATLCTREVMGTDQIGE